PPEDSLLVQTGDIAMFMDWFCKRRGITELKPQDLEDPTFEIIKVSHPDVILLEYQTEECHKLLTNSVDDSILRHNVSKPLPQGGPLGQVTIQSDFIFNKDLEYLRYGSKGSRHALSISKMKAAYYPDVGLEQMVPDQMWIEHLTGDIATFMDWFCKRRGITELKPQDLEGPAFEIVKVFHPDVIPLQFQMEECHKLLTDSMDDPIIRHNMKAVYYPDAGLEQMVPDQFWIKDECKYDILQCHLNHLPPKDKKILTTAINLWTRHLVIRQRVEDFHLWIESYQTQLNLPNLDGMPRALNTSTTTHDGTLQQIDEALDYQVMEFKINRMNPGLNTRFLTRNDVDRSKAFMFAIQKRLKITRIFRNLESFIGGRVRNEDYRLLKRTE
nr:hypothetical protein [Tanacetum cinerariifolium]